MKQIKFLAFALFAVAITNAQVGIGTTSPDASAVLELKTSDKGLLIPRLTTTEITEITSPAEGLIVYNVTEKCIQVNVGDAATRDFECLGAGDGGGSSSTTTRGVFSCEKFETALVEHVSLASGRTWMDRNLGASQAATSIIDPLAFGFLFQWGRAADCHQYRDSGETPNGATVLASPTYTDASPQTIHFITTNGTPDGPGSTHWTSLPATTQASELWQGLTGTNNPCPTNFRIPTEEEWRDEMSSTSTVVDGNSSHPSALDFTRDTAPENLNFALGLTVGGLRTETATNFGTKVLTDVPGDDPISTIAQSKSGYWTSDTTVSDGVLRIRTLEFDQLFVSTSMEIFSAKPAEGLNVRCIKATPAEIAAAAAP